MIETEKRTFVNTAAWSKQTWKLFSMPMLLFLAIPILSLFIHSSPKDLLQNLNERQVTQAISLSLATSCVTTALTLVLGTPVAYLLGTRKFKGYHIVDTLIDIPTVLPPSVAGVALLMAFGRRGLVGTLLAEKGITIPFTFIAVVMAQLFIASPLYVRSAAVGFSGIEKELKQAAALDGANRWQVFRYIVLPLSANALLSGSVMTWARALGSLAQPSYSRATSREGHKPCRWQYILVLKLN